MLKKLSETLYEELAEQLKTESCHPPISLRCLAIKLSIVRDYLRKLKTYLSENSFVDRQQEIWFFKHQNPRFYKWLAYYHELYTINSNRPLHGKKAIVQYLAAQLEYFSRIFRLNEFQYQYYRMGATEMDEIYFLRSSTPAPILAADGSEIDLVFGTGTSYLFAKFMAYEKLREEITSEILLVENPSLLPSTHTGQQNISKKGCQWTGEVVNLIEIAHAIYLNKQVNEGEIGINDFFERLGNFFGVNLGVPKRGFEDLKARKRLSKTNFIDRMKETILKKMDEEDTYNPNISTYKNSY